MGEEGERWFEIKHLVEDVGLLLEAEGIPRMAGRILGWLLICNPPHQTIDELAAALQASKGSISTMTRYLIQLGLVERVGLPGQRRDYFRFRTGQWSSFFKEELRRANTLLQLAKRGLDLLEGQDPELQLRLREVHDLYAFFERELPVLLQRWEQERQQREGTQA